MHKINFTKHEIELIKPPPKKIDRSGNLTETWVDYQDSQSRFLFLRVRSSGRKTFYYVRKISGKVNWIKLDMFPEMTIFQAREKCAEISGEFAKGKDPVRERKELKKSLRFQDLFDNYMELHSRPHKKSWKWDELNYRNHLQGLGKVHLSDITPETISRTHKQIAEHSGQGQANRTLALIKAIFNFGLKQRFFDGINPAMGIQMFKEHSRERFLNADELHRFFDALESEVSPDMRDFFLLTLYTGARRGNMQSMKWSDLDLDSGIWSIPEDQSKSGESMKVVLSEEAVSILVNRRENCRISSPFVFSSHGKTGHMTEPKRAWVKILKKAGLENLWIHDLRRTLGSWQAALGAGLPIIGKSLGHKNERTTAIYAKLDLDSVRASVNAAVTEMLKQKK